ncbi:helix-turn-helix transcriptional regulator [Luteibaculum oceani]|uniref:helix-turn-helix transcriptional regulator n=1 Tax=Luteibaculum oceani TaxID=1294296 RepID=UPI001476B0ED|nr:helix-turn-helix transcriptional regulator [Luteibaculum oceani]
MSKADLKQETILILKNLKKVHETLGLSQTELSRDIDWDYQSYSKMERGIYHIQAELLLPICKRFKVKSESFFDFDEVVKSNVETNTDLSIADEEKGEYAAESPISLTVSINPNDPKFMDLLKAFVVKNDRDSSHKKK